MKTYVENLKFGSLYHIQTGMVYTIVDYDDPISDKWSNGKRKTLYSKNLFVPLAIVAKNDNLLRIKVLLVDGTIWYMNSLPADLRFLEELSDADSK